MIFPSQNNYYCYYTCNLEVRILMFLLSAKKSIKKQYIFPCICKIDMMNFIRNIMGGKNCTPITTGNNHWTAVRYYASNL